MQTGLGTFMVLPVGERVPVSLSRCNTSILLPSRQATSRYLPLGVMIKLRGCLPVL